MNFQFASLNIQNFWILHRKLKSKTEGLGGSLEESELQIRKDRGVELQIPHSIHRTSEYNRSRLRLAGACFHGGQIVPSVKELQAKMK
ncbi:hypothetical protein B0E43_02550 [Algoriphagus sp. A40]|nr:hypothetical protein B0E43_02550 [Algoriphagus sp. A40]